MTLSVYKLRKAATVLHGITAAVAIAVIVLSGLALGMSAVKVLSPRDIFLSGIVVASLTAAVQLVGLVAALNSKQRLLFVIYALLMTGMIAYGIVSCIAIGKDRSDTHVRSMFDSLWDTATNDTIWDIQDYGQCCGFDDYADRPQEPCIEYDPPVGCFPTMEEYYQNEIEKTITPAIILLSFMAAAWVTNATLAILAWRENGREQMVQDRKPFDEWHKAVFQ